MIHINSIKDQISLMGKVQYSNKSFRVEISNSVLLYLIRQEIKIEFAIFMNSYERWNDSFVHIFLFQMMMMMGWTHFRLRLFVKRNIYSREAEYQFLLSSEREMFHYQSRVKIITGARTWAEIINTSVTELGIRDSAQHVTYMWASH